LFQGYSNLYSEVFDFAVAYDDPIVGRSLVEEAVNEFHGGHYDNACQLLSKAVLYRDTAARRLLLARAAESNGDYELAVLSLKKAREIDPLPQIVSEIKRVKVFVADLAEQEQQEAEDALRKRLLAERIEGGVTNFNSIREQIIDLTKADSPGLEAEDDAPPAPTSEQALDIQTFIQGLASSSTMVKSRSIDGLVATGRVDVAPDIALLLKDSDSLLRMDAAMALGRLASPHTIVNLLEQLFVETDKDVVEQLIAAIGKVNNSAVAQGLKRYSQAIPRAGKAFKQIQKVLLRLNR